MSGAHSTSNSRFEICQATEKALVAQIVEAVDPIYIRALLNRATGQYSSSIRAVVTHLFTTHGKIMPQQVKAKEQEAYGMHYIILQPVDTVFNNINDLSDLEEHANSPMSAQQQIDLAMSYLRDNPFYNMIFACGITYLWLIAHGPTCSSTSGMLKLTLVPLLTYTTNSYLIKQTLLPLWPILWHNVSSTPFLLQKIPVRNMLSWRTLFSNENLICKPVEPLTPRETGPFDHSCAKPNAVHIEGIQNSSYSGVKW
jgi:hypothetical protein